jgi:hypothetical protein
MGEIAKKIIGIIAAAAAAPIVTMFTDMAKVESASRDDKALLVREEFFISRNRMRPSRLRVDCPDADLRLRDHRSHQTDTNLRG